MHFHVHPLCIVHLAVAVAVAIGCFLSLLGFILSQWGVCVCVRVRVRVFVSGVIDISIRHF